MLHPTDSIRSIASTVTLLAMVLALFGGAAPLDAQLIQGRVLDSESGEPVTTARVSLLTADGDRVDTALTDAQGRFMLRPRSAGRHVLEADRLGYGPQQTEAFDVEAQGVVRQDVMLVPRAVEVEGIVVEGYPGRLLHEATLAGVYARRARSPSVGSNRVIVRGEEELDSQFRVRDVLPYWLPGPNCPRRDERGRPLPWVFIDGWESKVRGPGSEAFILDLSVQEVVAIEFYRDINMTPFPLRPDSRGRTARGFELMRACGVVAVWTWGAPR